MLGEEPLSHSAPTLTKKAYIWPPQTSHTTTLSNILFIFNLLRWKYLNLEIKSWFYENFDESIQMLNK